MSKRRNLFETLVEKGNINLEVEYRTIKKLLEQPRNVDDWDSIYNALDYYIIPDWKYANRCVELNDLREKLQITHRDMHLAKYPLEKCLLFF